MFVYSILPTITISICVFIPFLSSNKNKKIGKKNRKTGFFRILKGSFVRIGAHTYCYYIAMRSRISTHYMHKHKL